MPGALVDQQGFVVLDGGLATELEARGESLNDPLWSAKILITAPERIGDVHHAYFVAGADVGTTASYQATFEGLRDAGLRRDQAEEVMRRSVTVALEARDRFWNQLENRIGRFRPLIAASVGPYGAFLHDGSEYTGNYGGVSLDALKAFHRERLALLSESGADLLACETIPSLLEAKALIALLNEFSQLPAWMSFICKDDAHLSDGTKFIDAVSLAAESPSVVAIGLNCTAPHLVNSLLEKAKAITEKPLVVYPNSGEYYDSTTRSWRFTSKVGMIETSARGWYERGARFIGGCCRTTPETIRGIRSALTGANPAIAGSGNS